jgi:hypothetical protein
VRRPTRDPYARHSNAGTAARRARRQATEPLTARDIVVSGGQYNIKRPDKAALAHLTGSILASLRNHKGNGIERTNEGAPARWRLKEVAD